MTELNDGVGIVPVAMGLFGLGDIIHMLRHGSAGGTAAKVKSLIPTRRDFRDMTPAILRGSFIGSALGILPGGGALLSSFIAYAVERRISAHPQQFGEGAIQGVAAPEAANNAGAQTSFIPMLTLGIPSNVIMALLAGAMIINGIQPGPAVMTEQPQLFWGVIASMWIGNAILLVLNLPLVRLWVRLTDIPYQYLYPAIMLFCCIGAYSVNNSVFDIYVLLFFGVVGYGLKVFDLDATPLLLGILLGPMLEEYMRRALLLAHGDLMIFIERPISAVLLAVSLLAVVAASLPGMRARRDAALTE